MRLMITGILIQVIVHFPGLVGQVVQAFEQIPESQRLVIVFDDLVGDVVQSDKVVFDEMREWMVEEFSSDIDLLADLLRRDLSHWKTTHSENA